MAHYRTRTYIAADWDGDSDLVDKLHEWNENERLNLNFTDAHDLTQSRDDSLPCTIKESLSERMNASKTFVLIVGDNTDNLTKGACRYCKNYSSTIKKCYKGKKVDQRSYIRYECEKAKQDEEDMKIVVIYNSCTMMRSKCPETLRYTGTHVRGRYKGTDGKDKWNYQDIKKAIMN